jgi:hypothetical protein
LSKLTEDGCGRRQMRPEAPSFSSRCQFVRIKNAVEHLDYELRQLWLFAPSWAGDIEQVDDVIVQESFQPLRCVWPAGLAAGNDPGNLFHHCVENGRRVENP